jgi:hypothetical protein
MNNCFVKVSGGIGNQLFQLAAGYTYSKQYNKELYIDDLHWNASQGTSPRAYQSSIFQNFAYWKGSADHVFNISEKRFNYDPLPYTQGSVALHGYFQSLKYFEDYKDEFVSKLALPDIEYSIDVDNAIAFHIRRGDYLKYPDIHHVCTTEYFKALFDKFKDRYRIHVFTDSPEYISEEFKGYEFDIQKTESDLHDLSLMSKYTKIVCSNSSFSWWASFLGDPSKYIIVPERWFGLNFENHDDIYRSDFIRVRCLNNN